MGRTGKKAQSLGEYTVITSLVVLAIMAMTYFMQRGFAARINDARDYMITTLEPEMAQVRFSRGWKPDGRMRVEYEPYYVDKTAHTMLTPETNLLINGEADTYVFRSKTRTAVNSVSMELPPENNPE